MLYEYVTTSGQMAKVEANSPEEAMKKAPGIAKNSGVSLVQNTVPTKTVTPTKTLPPLPNTQSTPAPTATKTLPEVPSNNSRLLSFSTALTEAVNVARNKRMQAISSIATDGVPAGVRSASDLSGLMKGLSNVNDSFEEPLVNTATRAYESDLTDINSLAKTAALNGASQGIVNQILGAKNPSQALILATPFLGAKQSNDDKSSIRQLATSAAQNGAPPDVITQILGSDNYEIALISAQPYIQKNTDDGVDPTPSTKSLYSGALMYTATDISKGSQMLENSKGQDGYVDPTVYLNMYKKWTASGGLPQDFTKQYPPKIYVNPQNTWLPANLKSGTGAYTPEDNEEGEIKNFFR